MKKLTCAICKTKGVQGFRGFYIEGEVRYYCGQHVSEAPVRHGRRGVWDATGTQRDRNWLNKKLELTKSEKNWHNDIKSRKVLPTGEVARFSEKGKRIG